MIRRLALAAVPAISILSATAAMAGGSSYQYGSIKDEPVPEYRSSWTGFHLGGHVGYGWENIDLERLSGGAAFPVGTRRNRDVDGFLGGVQIGYDHEFSNWVLGIGADFSWTGMDGSDRIVNPAGTRINTTKSEINWIATLTGRLGYLAHPDVLLYGKGGVAWVDSEGSGATTDAGGVVRGLNTASGTRTGWTIGAGAEWQFARNWSMNLEYNFIDLGEKIRVTTVTDPNGVLLTPTTNDSDVELHLVKLGLNYRF